MPDYVLVQAVNLRHVIDDTEDLSTRRAGGYMLLELVHRIEDACKGLLEKISIGASEGLFALRPGQEMASARSRIESLLRQAPFRHATVKVADTASSGLGPQDLSTAREALLAVLRQQQMQQLSFATVFEDGPVSATAAGQVCTFDKVRPAVAYLADEEAWVSLSVRERRTDGRRLRQSFYQRELARWSDAAADYSREGRFTGDLVELTRMTPAERRDWSSLLEGKMALLYADGNGFGRIKATCQTPQAMADWDRNVQSARRTFLFELLQTLREDPAGPQDVIRLETLMWGGDEFMLVLPAWQALRAAQLFFEHCRVLAPDGTAQTHSAALVMAHHKSPIYPLQQLARQLADQGKQGLWKGHDSLHWLALESFDHAGGDLGSYWRTRGLSALSWADIALSPVGLHDVLVNWPRVATCVPRRNLFRIVDGLRAWDRLGTNEQRLLSMAYENVHAELQQATALEAWKALWHRLMRGGGTDEGRWPDSLTAQFVSPAHLKAWLTLTELADYLPTRAGADA